MASLNARLETLERRHGTGDEPHPGRVILYHEDRPKPLSDCCGPVFYLPCKRDGAPCPLCDEEARR